MREGIQHLKTLLTCLLFFILLWTSPAYARLVVLSPETMIEKSQFIVTGEVIEIRGDRDDPDFVLDVVRVYKGEVGTARLVIPQPGRSGMPGDNTLLAPPAVGTQILLFIVVNEAGRFVPTADLNWMGILEDDRVLSLYMGAAVNEWDEERYLRVYNEYLDENPGRQITPPQKGEEVTEEETRPHGMVNPAIFFFMAGVAFLMLVVSAKLKKLER
jgi:hypothetical protein